MKYDKLCCYTARKRFGGSKRGGWENSSFKKLPWYIRPKKFSLLCDRVSINMDWKIYNMQNVEQITKCNLTLTTINLSYRFDWLRNNNVINLSVGHNQFKSSITGNCAFACTQHSVQFTGARTNNERANKNGSR